MKKLKRYELMYLKLMFLFIFIALFFAVIYSVKIHDYGFMLECIILLFAFSLFNLGKFIIIKKLENTYSCKVFMIFRVVEVLFILYCMIFVDDSIQWASMLIVFPIIITGLCMGTKSSLFLVGFTFIVHISMYLLHQILFLDYRFGDIDAVFIKSILGVFFYSIPAMFAGICGMIYQDNARNEKINYNLMEQLENKYKQLKSAQTDVKLHYKSLKDTNSELEQANEKLSTSVAQLYTLQKLSQMISTVLNVSKLLTMINDAIIGLMGVDYSTILLYDKETERLKVHTTNIDNSIHMQVLNDSMNCAILYNILDNGAVCMENNADCEYYPFIKGRNIKSLCIIPIATKSNKLGLVIIERKMRNAFNEENLGYLNMISQQVGIAMENAELYREMKELANRDHLTGVHNRLYFRDRLETELNNAKRKNYNLSLAIFDIDFFKKFNDNHGHIFGDKVIKEIALLVKDSLRRNDVIARYGGEEFVLIMPGTNLRDAYEKAERLRKIISEKTIRDNNITVSVTASFGVSNYPECAYTQLNLIKSADNALYMAKSTGRNCVVVANPIKQKPGISQP